MAKNEYGNKVNQALAYLRIHGDTDAARHAAAMGNEVIDTAQWADATRRYKQEQGKAAA